MPSVREALLRAGASAALAWICGVAPLAAQEWRTVTMSRALTDDEEVRVVVEYGAGEFRVRPTDEAILYRMTLRYNDDAFEPVAEYRPGRLNLGIEGRTRHFDLKGRDKAGEMDLVLGRGVPMDLELNFGAVRADIDLSGLALIDLDLRTGASEARIQVSEPNTAAMETTHIEVGAADFEIRDLGNLNAERIDVDAGVGSVTLWLTGRWQRDGHLSVDMGLGALEIRIPEGLGVRLRKDSFLTALDAEGLIKRGRAYYSPDWEEADRRVTIDLDAAFGAVTVVWVR